MSDETLQDRPEFVPHLEWFTRRWGLPAACQPAVRRLLEAAEMGSTVEPLAAEEFKSAWAQLQAKQAAVHFARAGEPLPTPPSPLVVLEHEGLHLLQRWRDHKLETQIAQDLRTRASQSLVMHQARLPAPLLGGLDELQQDALRKALECSLTLIIGGPGTGKTYTLARILALLLVNGVAPGRVALAAPTGKAAQRMREAIAAASEHLPADFATHKDSLLSIAAQVTTLHRLLGVHPLSQTCRQHAGNPLPCDVLIIDEASMIDVYLWGALLKAHPPGEGRRLIVLGDANQLESVGTGVVLAQLTGAVSLQDNRVQLLKTRRFETLEGLKTLAAAVVSNDPAAAATVLAQARDDSSQTAATGLHWYPRPPRRFSWKVLPQPVKQAIEAIAWAPTPEEALTSLSKVQILVAHREHSLGALGVSKAIHEHLSRQGRSGRPNLPVIVNVNAPQHGLSNGTMGILTTRPDGTEVVYFQTPGTTQPLRSFSPAQLPDHSPAWALTVHRSQGSEYDTIVVVLPAADSPLASRALLYTAITRARQNVHLFGDLQTVRKAVESTSPRTSALGLLLLPLRAEL